MFFDRRNVLDKTDDLATEKIDYACNKPYCKKNCNENRKHLVYTLRFKITDNRQKKNGKQNRKGKRNENILRNIDKKTNKKNDQELKS